MASPVSTAVKFYLSTQSGASTLSGSAGALIGVLDACLVTGFGIKTVTSLVVASGVATMTVGSPHGFVVGGIALVAGATPTTLNGEQKVTAISSTTVSFATAQANVTATGTINVRVAPAGWTKVYTGTNVAVYKSSDVTGTGCLIRVDDTGTQSARVTCFESMADINTGSGRFPLELQVPGGYHWNKSGDADSVARSYTLFADSRCFYLGTAPALVAAQNHQHAFFGDLTSYKSGDAYGCAVSGSAALSVYYAGSEGCLGTSRYGSVGAYLPRSYTAIGGSQGAEHLGVAGWTTLGTSGALSYNVHGNFPNNANNGLLLTKVLCKANLGIRGEFPGIWHTAQDCAQNFSTGDIVTGMGTLSGTKVMAVRTGPTNPDANNTGTTFFDITGPWR